MLGRRRTRMRDNLIGEVLRSIWLEYCCAQVIINCLDELGVWHNIEHP